MGGSGRPGCSCSVAICSSPKEAIYHTFPKNSHTEKLWIIACKREGTINVKNARICSKHFKDDDYERDLQHELLNLPPRKRLKADAVPSVGLFPGKILKNIIRLSQFLVIRWLTWVEG